MSRNYYKPTPKIPASLYVSETRCMYLNQPNNNSFYIEFTYFQQTTSETKPKTFTSPNWIKKEMFLTK